MRARREKPQSISTPGVGAAPDGAGAGAEIARDARSADCLWSARLGAVLPPAGSPVLAQEPRPIPCSPPWKGEERAGVFGQGCASSPCRAPRPPRRPRQRAAAIVLARTSSARHRASLLLNLFSSGASLRPSRPRCTWPALHRPPARPPRDPHGAPGSLLDPLCILTAAGISVGWLPPVLFHLC